MGCVVLVPSLSYDQCYVVAYGGVLSEGAGKVEELTPQELWFVGYCDTDH